MEELLQKKKSLIAHLSKWSFLLSMCIWYDILFQVNKASKILQSYGVSLHTTETEIQQLKSFCKTIAQPDMTVLQHMLLK